MLETLFVVALTVRIAVLVVTLPTPLAGDEHDYFQRAKDFSETGEIDHGWHGLGGRAPFTGIFYGGLFSVFSPLPVVAKIANALVGAVVVFPVFFLGRAVAGNKTGMSAAAVAAIYPNYVGFGSFLWAENIYIVFVISGLALLVHIPEDPGPWRIVVAGILFGLGALTREVGLVYPVFATFWMVWCSTRSNKISVTVPLSFFAAFALTILPWTIIVNIHHENFVLITNTTYYNLLLGNGDHFSQNYSELKKQYDTLGETTSEREREARSLVLRALADEELTWPVAKVSDQLPRLFTPNSFVVHRLLKPLESGSPWAYRFKWSWLEKGWIRVLAVVLTVSAYVLLGVLGAAGLVLVRRSPAKVASLLFVFSQVLPTIMAFGCSRFRLASMAVFMIGAGFILAEGRDVWAGVPQRRRVAAVLVGLVMLLIISVRYSSVLSPTWG